MKKLKIGVTICFDGPATSIWSNGVNQNVIHLYHLLQNAACAEEVVLVARSENIEIPEWLKIEGKDFNIVKMDGVVDTLDVLIEAGQMVRPEDVERVRKHGGKVVSYKIGNEYILHTEYMLFNPSEHRICRPGMYDDIWLLPHHNNTCQSYNEIMHRCNSAVVPMIWSPLFCDQVIGYLGEEWGLEFGYKTNPKKSKRVASFEPNLNVCKTSLIPILMAEQAYRKDPRAIEHYYAFNTLKLNESKTFEDLIANCDIARDGVMTLEGFDVMPARLTHYADVVICHQWENGLNYAYFDALYGKYPLIHNSTLLPEGVGYRYDGFNAKQGAGVLLEVIANHDSRVEEYNLRVSQFLETLHPTNPTNVVAYEREILKLFEV